MFKRDVYGSFVGGEWQTGGEKAPHISPVTGEKWTTLHPATDSEIQKGLMLLHENPLKEMNVYDRAAILEKTASLLLKHQEELATVITMEMGKPIEQARTEVSYTASYFTWFAAEALRIYGMTIPSHFNQKRLQLRHEPVGPCALITPWNFPIAMAGRKMAPAFAAGCPIIAKPSSETPVSLLLLAALCVEGGIPKQAVHVLIGSGQKIGKAFLDAFHIRKLSFTGSVEVGQHLYRESAATVKKLTMELGGNAPLIVFDDADLERAVEEGVLAKFRQSGQTCVCVNRFLVQKGIHDAFVKRFIEKVQALKVGNPLEDTTELSVSIHPLSQEKAKKHVADAIAKGAKAHLEAKEAYEPQVLTGVTPDMLIMNEETFGPVAAIHAFDDEETAIKIANSTPYGLASYVFTENLKRAENVVAQLEFGIVGLNDGLPSCAQLPFGGVKVSGFGREGGPIGIYEYLTEKVVSHKL